VTAAPLPPDEVARLEALRRFEVLDTELEPAFERLTRLVARLLDVPIALVSLVDEQRQWFKSRVGLAVGETPREQSFCAHTILGNEPLVVQDATADSRFATNSLVLGDPGIRAYAGAPLRTADGYNLGTLCAIDRRPRKFSEDQLEILRELAAVAVDELELRRERRRALAVAMSARDTSEEQRLLFEHAPLALWTLDAKGMVRAWNRAAEQVFGWTAEEVIGKFLPTLGPEQRPEYESLARELAEQKVPRVVERRRQRKNGGMVDIRLAVAPLLNDSGTLRGYLTIAQDMAEEIRLREELKRAAMVDVMTGLFNRRGFEDLARRELARARRDHSPFSLVMFDIDHFKQINDSRGHAIGDRVLGVVASIIAANLRGTDVGVRWGGEEILVLLPGSDATVALLAAERIRTALANHAQTDLPTVTISGGVAQWQPDESIDATVMRADRRMYEAKAGGRNRVC
jgi:diguanylate cyclase (GGDEF)-like protein/PAS domain S-box-containing protein